MDPADDRIEDSFVKDSFLAPNARDSTRFARLDTTRHGVARLDEVLSLL